MKQDQNFKNEGNRFEMCVMIAMNATLSAAGETFSAMPFICSEMFYSKSQESYLSCRAFLGLNDQNRHSDPHKPKTTLL